MLRQKIFWPSSPDRYNESRDRGSHWEESPTPTIYPNKDDHVEDGSSIMLSYYYNHEIRDLVHDRVCQEIQKQLILWLAVGTWDHQYNGVETMKEFFICQIL